MYDELNSIHNAIKINNLIKKKVNPYSINYYFYIPFSILISSLSHKKEIKILSEKEIISNCKKNGPNKDNFRWILNNYM